jgi:copper transport protein
MARVRPIFAGLLLGVAAVVLGPGVPASAHATLVGSDPPAGAVLAAPPQRVVLTFSEPIRPVSGKSLVVAPDGARVDTGTASVRGDRLTIPLRAVGTRGTYLVSYRVISADSHPVAGGLTFSVGAASTPPALPAAAARTDPVVAVALAAARYAGFAGLVLTVGPALVLALLWPYRLGRRGPLRLVALGLSLVGAATVAELYLQAPYSAGTGPFGASADDLAAVFSSQYGAAHLVRLGVLGAAVLLLRPVTAGPAPDGRSAAGRADRALLAVLAVVGFATWPLSGHPVTSRLPALTVAADVAHLAAVSVWLGGLVMLVGYLLRLATPRELAAILPVWSGWALLAVSVLAFAGAVQALVQIGSVGALVATTYGRLVLAKIGLLALVVAVARYSRRLSARAAVAPARPADQAPPAGGAEAAEPAGIEPAEPAGIEPAGIEPDGIGSAGIDPAPPVDARRLRRAVLAELLVAAVILALASALVQTAPGGTARAASNRPAGPYAAMLTSPLFRVEVDVDPARVGDNAVHLYASTPAGAPLSVVEWRVTAALPARGIEPVAVPLLPITADHASGEAQLPVAGTWQLRITLRVSDFDQASVTAEVPVR